MLGFASSTRGPIRPNIRAVTLRRAVRVLLSSLLFLGTMRVSEAAPSSSSTGPAYIAWSGLFTIARDASSAFHRIMAREDPKVDAWLDRLRKQSSELKFSFPARVVLSNDELPNRGVGIDGKNLYSLVLVPNLEQLVHRVVTTKHGSFHDYRVITGVSALLVVPGTGRIAMTANAVRIDRVGVKSELSPDQHLDAFRKAYAAASLRALSRLQAQRLSAPNESPALVTDVFVEDADLRKLFGVTGSAPRLGPRTCSTRACITMGNLAAQLTAQRLCRAGEFVVPPMTGTMSELGTNWAFGAEDQLTLYAAVDTASDESRAKIRLTISPERADRFVAARITRSSAEKVSARIEKWHFIVQGRIQACANWNVQTEEERVERTKSRSIVSCDAGRDPKDIMRFSNDQKPIVYKSYRKVPELEDRRRAFTAALQNALGK